MKVSGYAHNLAVLDWQLFGTLTFKKTGPKPKMWGCAWLHFQRLARITGTEYSALRIALRYELGEQTERPHFHYLLGGLAVKNHVSASYVARREWGARVGSFATIRAYDSAQAGASYICKCLGANAYERSKFDSADEVCLSDAVFRDMNETRQFMQTAGLLPVLAQPLAPVEKHPSVELGRYI